MKATFWRRWCRSLVRADRARPTRRRLGLHPLEDRVTPALTPEMILDINTNTPGSNPADLLAIGSTTYFTADDRVNGRVLWKTDGTAAGTVLVKDVTPDGIDAALGRLMAVNGTLFFTTYDDTRGTKLWTSDGTAAGTVVVKDVAPSFVGPTPVDLAAVNGTLYFPAYDGVSGTELWRTDGTTAGTALVKDIDPGASSSFPGVLTAVNGTLFFTARSGAQGFELWKSDGTAAGTVLVKDIRSGTGTGSYPSRLTNVNGTLFFTADNGTHGEELWKSDGTATGTVMVRDVDPRTSPYGSVFSSIPNYLTAVNGTLFFSAFTESGRELWKSDGTAAGTVLVKDIQPGHGSYPQSLTAVGGTLFFNARDGVHHDELWKTDGTAAGTVMVKDINPDPVGATAPSSLVNVNGTLYFAVSYWNVNGTPSGNPAVELWKSDGTEAGTVLVKGFEPGSTPAGRPGSLTNANGTLLFTAAGPRTGLELWRSDGTAAGTTQVKDINANTVGSTPGAAVEVNGTLYFAADDGVHGYELWKSDGTVAGTTLVKDIAPGGFVGYYGGFYPNGSSPVNLINVNGTLFFTSYVWPYTGLWKSDGTAAGTVRVSTVVGQSMTAVGDTLFFAADDGLHGTELWKSDGTAAGTTMIKDIDPGSHREYGYYGGYWDVPNSSTPANLTHLNGTLFFTATDVEGGRELWKSDGTAAGTVLVKDIFPGTYGGNPGELTNVNGTLLFAARDGLTHGWELWRSDGTAAGTTQVKDIRPGSNGSYPSALTTVNGTVYFRATDGTTGAELWKTDGTTAGTVRVLDIAAGSTGAYPNGLTDVNGTLFFSAFQSPTGRELWKSDGTAAGTVLVKDLAPIGWGDPAALTAVGGTLYFTANDAGVASALWQSDGTTDGTRLVLNRPTGGLTAYNGTLAFTADDGTHGRELWHLVPGGPAVTVGGATVTEGNVGTTAATFTVRLSEPSDQPVTVAYATADGTADGADYLPTSGTLTFAPGETSKIITVLVNGDRVGEPNETFLVNLSGATNATVVGGQGVGTILDDEPRVRIGDATVAEGNTGTRAVNFAVTLSAAYDQPVSVAYATSNDTAIAGTDYRAAAGTLTIPAGQTSGTITVLVTGDRVGEVNETFFVTLSGATNAAVESGQAVGTIADDEPRVRIGDVSRAEGRNGQTTLFTFTVTLSVAYDQPVTMSYRTANGTAKTSNNDYTAKSGTLTFAPGETTKTITIVVRGDNKREADETFYLDLTGISSNALSAKSRGVGTILNDD